jgi:hypothetical protein
MLTGFAGGQRDDFQLFVGGKSSGGDRSVEHLEGQRDRAGESVLAKESPCCDSSRVRWQPGDWKADPWPPTARSAGSGRPKPAEWNGLGSEPATVAVRRGPRQSREQMDLA